MQHTDREWSLTERLLFAPSILLLASGVYVTVSGGRMNEQFSLILGLTVFSVGVYLWMQTRFYGDARQDLASRNEEVADLEGRGRMLEDKTADFRRELELLAAQREVSRVASGDIEDEHSESLLCEILRVVSNLIHVEEGTEVEEIAIFLRDSDSGELTPAAAKYQDSVMFGTDVDVSRADLSMVAESGEHRITVSSVEKNTAGFALPLIADQDLIGVMYVEVILRKEGAELSEGIRCLHDSLQQMSQHVSLPLMRHVLKSTSVTDGLTKLHNKSYFLKRLEEYFGIFKRGGFDLSLLMIDIDHFKNINDEYGHLAGDTILVQVADLVVKTIRSCDVAYSSFRYGGEEISVLLPRTDGKRALSVARRMRRGMADNKFSLDDDCEIRVTMSVGLAQATNGLENKEGLISQADSALYRAKRTGRNRVCTWRGKKS